LQSSAATARGRKSPAKALKVSEAAAKKFGFKINWHPYDFGGERYLKTGEVLPDGAVDELRKFKAIFLGAVGHPQVKPGILEKGILLRLRFELEQYINLRPVKLYRAAGLSAQGQGAGAR
jgi:3-isopropylmalate dehydrogenase